ncbi:hypothetical protein, partial [Halomonas sp. SYSU XM8]|uniref:hypothetical protein n=1 Tax=Halomonas sp. SYSU XM8 TaxID=2109329 RepID=UPI001C6279F0
MLILNISALVSDEVSEETKLTESFSGMGGFLLRKYFSILTAWYPLTLEIFPRDCASMPRLHRKVAVPGDCHS